MIFCQLFPFEFPSQSSLTSIFGDTDIKAEMKPVRKGIQFRKFMNVYDVPFAIQTNSLAPIGPGVNTQVLCKYIFSNYVKLFNLNTETKRLY